MRLGVTAVGACALGYVAAYLSLLRNESYFLCPYPSQRNITVKLEPEYRFGGVVAKVVFAPACAVDRIVRPSRWQVEYREGVPSVSGR
jgi:hypothetical protein